MEHYEQQVGIALAYTFLVLEHCIRVVVGIFILYILHHPIETFCIFIFLGCETSSKILGKGLNLGILFWSNICTAKSVCHFGNIIGRDLVHKILCLYMRRAAQWFLAVILGKLGTGHTAVGRLFNNRRLKKSLILAARCKRERRSQKWQ